MHSPVITHFRFARTILLVAGLAAALAGNAAAAPAAARSSAHVVFLVSSPDDPNSYESARTVPTFAGMLRDNHGYRTTVLQATMLESAQATPPESASKFSNIKAVWEADLLVIFCRRLGLPPDQLTAIKNHLNAGKPVVGIKTANHGFAVRGTFVPGHFGWWEFVADVLGAENRGYAPVPEGTTVKVVPAARNHPILRGLPNAWQTKNNLYLNTLLDPNATVLLTGEADGKIQPIAWARMAGRSRVFYTSLGHPVDWDDTRPLFRNLLLNGIRWALGGN